MNIFTEDSDKCSKIWTDHLISVNYALGEIWDKFVLLFPLDTWIHANWQCGNSVWVDSLKYTCLTSSEWSPTLVDAGLEQNQREYTI